MLQIVLCKIKKGWLIWKKSSTLQLHIRGEELSNDTQYSPTQSLETVPLMILIFQPLRGLLRPVARMKFLSLPIKFSCSLIFFLIAIQKLCFYPGRFFKIFFCRGSSEERKCNLVSKSGKFLLQWVKAPWISPTWRQTSFFLVFIFSLLGKQ